VVLRAACWVREVLVRRGAGLLVLGVLVLGAVVLVMAQFTWHRAPAPQHAAPASQQQH
jgi:hypothetical protein